MKRLALAGVFYLVLCGGVTPAEAGHWNEAGSKVWGWTTGLIVTTDKVLHWTWDTLHNKVVHPLVNTLTLGTVDLNQPPA